MDNSLKHIMIFEPNIKGHHITWLRYITEDFLSAGFQLTLAVDLRPSIKEFIFDQLNGLKDKVNFISVFKNKRQFKGGSKIMALARCFKESCAHEVFVTSLDEFASSCFRRSFLRIDPPKIIKGKISGVYFRPRFLQDQFWPPGNLIKLLGFKRLCQAKWFKKIYILDEYLYEQFKTNDYNLNICFLPDPWSGDYDISQKKARSYLDLPEDKFILLNYGIGDKRKGLHLVAHVMLESFSNSDIFLLCAGQLKNSYDILEACSILQKCGKAKILNRYISADDERICFAASDAIVLPYIKHFGSSGILSRAAAAGKMIIASDEGLIAKRVCKYNLGLVFTSGSIDSLKDAVKKAMQLSQEEKQAFQMAGFKYSALCSRQAFRKALLS